MFYGALMSSVSPFYSWPSIQREGIFHTCSILYCFKGLHYVIFEHGMLGKHHAPSPAVTFGVTESRSRSQGGQRRGHLKVLGSRNRNCKYKHYQLWTKGCWQGERLRTCVQRGRQTDGRTEGGTELKHYAPFKTGSTKW